MSGRAVGEPLMSGRVAPRSPSYQEYLDEIYEAKVQRALIRCEILGESRRGESLIRRRVREGSRVVKTRRAPPPPPEVRA